MERIPERYRYIKACFFDKSSVDTGMTRLYGRASGHERVVDFAPDCRFLPHKTVFVRASFYFRSVHKQVREADFSYSLKAFSLTGKTNLLRIQ